MKPMNWLPPVSRDEAMHWLTARAARKRRVRQRDFTLRAGSQARTIELKSVMRQVTLGDFLAGGEREIMSLFLLGKPRLSAKIVVQKPTVNEAPLEEALSRPMDPCDPNRR